MQNRKCRKDPLAISITLNIMKPVKTEAVEKWPPCSSCSDASARQTHPSYP